jgi:hypothetical protein
VSERLEPMPSSTDALQFNGYVRREARVDANRGIATAHSQATPRRDRGMGTVRPTVTVGDAGIDDERAAPLASVSSHCLIRDRRVAPDVGQIGVEPRLVEGDAVFGEHRFE